MIEIRPASSIYRATGDILNGTFLGRWHFSFSEYYDQKNVSFGNLRVFNDDTLSPGAIWPLHPHHNIEVLTYCADGEFRHEDEHGKGGILKKGWFQHTTVGSGMLHSEINNRNDLPMRFIQMWFLPSRDDLTPSVEQKSVERKDRTNKLFMLVSNKNSEALKIFSDVDVYSCYLQKNHTVTYSFDNGRGGYLYVVENGPILIGEKTFPHLSAAKIIGEKEVRIEAANDAELLLIDTAL